MAWGDEVLIRLNELISAGEGITGRATRTAGQYFRLLNHGEFYGWRARSISALSDIVGDNHTYAKEFAKTCQSAGDATDRDAGVEILKSLKADIQAGHLRKLSNLISAEVFGDFLEMAQHLLDQGYKDPAASLTGAVLEDGLRRIARNHDIRVADRDNLNSLRDQCAQKQIFNNLVRKQITAWTELRDYADHGRFEKYTTQQVESLISDVRAFLSNYLA
jgi:hypothetical protein